MTTLWFALRARLRAIVRSRTLDREMRDEMALHLERATERFMRRGLSEAEARSAARREFGNVTLVQEEGRDARGARWIDSCAADLRFALRHFSRTPLTTATLVLVLALGIGVNSAIFSFVQVLTMRPPPAVAAGDALVRVRGIARSRAEGRLRPRDFSVPEFNAIAARRETFTSVAGWSADEMVVDLGEGKEPRALRGQFVTSTYFSTLGVRPNIGPGLPTVRTANVPGGELVAVIAHWLWEELGADTTVIGQSVRVNGVAVRVVGVAPPRFQGPISGPDEGASIWVPLGARPSLVSGTSHALVSRDSALLQAVARLAPDVTVDRATAAVHAVAAAWVQNEPVARDGDGRVEAHDYTSDVVPLRGDTAVGAGDALAFTLIGIAGLLILLIVCTNVSALLIGAAVARRKEIGVRLSLGASRTRIIRPLVTESSLIARAGGALGLMIYWAIIRGIAWAYIDPGIGPDLGTVAFTAFIALGTGIVFGLSPALHATRVDVASALKTAGGGATSRSRLQRSFIVAQICLTQPLLVGLAMIVGVSMSEVHAGGSDSPLANRITRADFGTGGASSGSPNGKQARLRATMERVAQLPGVDAVVPEASGFDVADVRVRATDRGNGLRAEETVHTHLEGAAPGYFALQNIPLLRGRDVIASDTAGRDMAVVIDDRLARGFWGTVDPIGKRLDVASKRPGASVTAVIVGVFDSSQATTRGAGRVYTAHGAPWRKDVYLIRTRGPGTSIVPVVRKVARATIPDIPPYRIVTLEQLARQERNDVMLLSASGSAGGLLALFLASIGIYGVVALAVRQRHREIGIRIALGARPHQVITMFFTSGLRLSILGIVLGLPLSVVALHLLATSVGGELSINMPLVGAAIAVIVVTVASLATWIPARRAATVDPLVAIRVE